jgi:toxin ParE1/3/4
VRFAVTLTDNALQDLFDLGLYIAEHDSPARAEAVLDRIEEAWNALRTSPDRGPIVPELLELNNRRYREVFFKPYRIIYQVVDDRVIVELIADGRRNMRTLLQQRLVQS